MGFSFGVIWFMPIGLPMGLGGLGMLASLARTNAVRPYRDRMNAVRPTGADGFGFSDFGEIYYNRINAAWLM
jgi:hypothetical protein